MQIETSLFGSQPYITWPNHLVGWLGLLAMILLFGWGCWRLREGVTQQFLKRWGWLVALFLLVVPTTLLLGLRLPGEILPVPARPEEVQTPAVMFLAAIPWVMAAGLLGPLPAALMALFSGFILAVIETHTPYTPFELGLLSLLFSMAIRQRYRTLIYRLLRHPVVASVVVMIGFTPFLNFKFDPVNQRNPGNPPGLCLHANLAAHSGVGGRGDNCQPGCRARLPVLAAGLGQLTSPQAISI